MKIYYHNFWKNESYYKLSDILKLFSAIRKLIVWLNFPKDRDHNIINCIYILITDHNIIITNKSQYYKLLYNLLKNLLF